MEFCVDWNWLCRICLSSFSDEIELKSIFLLDEKENTLLYEKINACTNLNIDPQSCEGPSNICRNCLGCLNTAYQFHSTVHSSNAIIQQILLLDNSIDTSNAVLSVDNGKMFSYIPPSGLKIQKVTRRKSILLPVVNERDIDINIRTESANEEQKSDNDTDSLISEYHDDEPDIVYTPPLENNLKIDIETLCTIPKIGNEDKPIVETVFTQINPDGTTRTLLKINRQPQKERYKCSICDKSYKYHYSLAIHEKRHFKQMDHECQICHKKFVIPFELKRHQRVHSGEKPYECQFCKKTFSDHGSKTKHERIHTGDRPYVCTFCGMAFAYSHVLKNHILVHTGEKKFSCQYCAKRFSKSHHLNSHLASHERKRVNIIEVENIKDC